MTVVRHWVLGCLAVALLAPVAQAADSSALPAQGQLQPAFAPWDDIDTLLVDVISQARRQVLVQAYLLTSKPLSAALIAAHRRGVDVQVMIDAQQLERVASSVAPALAAANVPVWLETKYQNAHNKVIVVDPGMPEAAVITGSFNFTWTAQHRNAENVLIVRDNPALAARYTANWERHRRDAVPYLK
jgi:phosphatidylserine/phosphatidylglycerophosphate/cardiolipin synthase-like enzyme